MLLILVSPVLIGAGFLRARTASQTQPQWTLPQWPHEEVDRFEAKRVPSEAEREHRESLALFAHGRWLMQRGQHAEALSRFQRAYRRDPRGRIALAEIVPLAMDLKRQAVAARYALLAAPRGLLDDHRMRSLGIYLSRLGRWRDALALYERILPADDQKLDVGGLLLRKEMGRLYYIEDEQAKAADMLIPVFDALKDPQQYQLNESLQELLLGNAEATYGLLADAFLAAGKLDLAEQVYRRELEVRKDDGLFALRMARVESERRKPQPALQSLEKFLTEDRDDLGPQPYQLLGEIFEQLEGDPNKGRRRLLEKLRELRAVQPKNAALGFFYAHLLRQEGQSEEAERVYALALQQNAVLEYYLELLRIVFPQKDETKAWRVLSQALPQQDGFSRLEEFLRPWLSDAERAESLLAVCQPLTEDVAAGSLDSRQQAAWRDRPAAGAVGACLALSLRKWALADTLASRAIAAAKEVGKKPADENESSGQQDLVELIDALATQFFSAKQYDAAAALYRRAIQEAARPDDVVVFYFYLAGACELAGKTEEALQAARKAAELSSDSALMKSREAWVLHHARRYEQAAAAYKRLLAEFDSHDDNEGIRQVMKESRLILSNIAVRRGDFPEGEEWLEQVLDEFPEDVGALNDLGYLWIDQQKRLRRAVAMVKRAVESEPENSAYRDSLGWGYYRLGLIDEAILQLEKAASLEKPDGVILDHLGDAYWKANQEEKAQENWRRAVRAFEETEDRQRARETQTKIDEYENERVGKRKG